MECWLDHAGINKREQKFHRKKGCADLLENYENYLDLRFKLMRGCLQVWRTGIAGLAREFYEVREIRETSRKTPET